MKITGRELLNVLWEGGREHQGYTLAFLGHSSTAEKSKTSTNKKKHNF